MQHYKRLRSNTRFTEFFNHVCDEARSLEVIEEPCLPRRRRIPQRLDNGEEGHFPGTVEDYYRQQYFEVLDLIVQDINNLFNCPSYNILKDVENLLIRNANGIETEIPNIQTCTRMISTWLS